MLWGGPGHRISKPLESLVDVDGPFHSGGSWTPT